MGWVLGNQIKLVYIYKGHGGKVPQTPPEITNGEGFQEDQQSRTSTYLLIGTEPRNGGPNFFPQKISYFKKLFLCLWNKQKDETMKTQTYKVTTRNEVLTIEEYAAFIYIKERDCQYPRVAF